MSKEKTYCLGEECKDKRCEICPSARTTQMESPKDSFRANKESFPIGYYSGNGIAKIKVRGADGKLHEKFVYTRYTGD